MENKELDTQNEKSTEELKQDINRYSHLIGFLLRFNLLFFFYLLFDLLRHGEITYRVFMYDFTVAFILSYLLNKLYFWLKK